MKKFNKIIAFTLVLTMLLSAQALGFNFQQIQAQAAGSNVNKNHSGAVLQNINTDQLNPDFVSVDKSVLEKNSTQTVKVGLGVDLTKVYGAVLSYQLEGSGKVMTQSTSDIQNGYITFSIAIGSKTAAGKYTLLDIQLKSKDKSLLNSVNLRTVAASYQVAESKSEAEALAKAVAPASAETTAESADNAAVVGVDKNQGITAQDIGKAISSAKKAMKSEDTQTQASAAQGNTVKAASNVTIVLDPGHGGSESGAAANGYLEKNLNLKIAQYAKAELETYSGVTVGMTRTGDTQSTLAARAATADAQGADILVSMHNNASGAGATGAEVWVSVLEAFNDSSTVLGNIILDQLSELGLYDRGVKTRPSENGTIYELTGELADYYGIIRESTFRGFPGIIIEHCFMDNADDAADYLSSDAKLKQLGVADATALAQYYGLQKKSTTPSDPVAVPANLTAKSSSSSSINVSWSAVSGATGYEVFRYDPSANTFKKIGETTGVSYNNTGLLAGTTYFYKVRSYVVSGGSRVYGVLSSHVSAKPVLAAPTNLKAAANGYNSITTTWSAVSGATGYAVYRYDQTAKTYKLIGDTTSTTYTDTGLSASTGYYCYYKVKAYVTVGGVKGYGDMSSEAYAKPAILPGPTNVAASSQGTGAISITWDSVSGATGYAVYRYDAAAKTYKQIAETTTASYTDTSLSGYYYGYYKVKSYTMSGSTKVYSEFSSQAYAKVN